MSIIIIFLLIYVYIVNVCVCVCVSVTTHQSAGLSVDRCPGMYPNRSLLFVDTFLNFGPWRILNEAL